MKRGLMRPAALVLVLLAHVLLLWAWRFVARPAPREPISSVTPNITVLRLIPAPPPPQPARLDSAPPSAATAPARSNSPPSPKPDAPVSAAPQAITVLAAPEPAASAPLRASDGLKLSVPRATAAPSSRTMKDQALNDPRANSPRSTVESRVANVSGASAMTEERMDDTKTRFRQNGACIEVHVSRDAQTNPWNQNHSPTPKIVKPSC
jgi:hypothetical protein